MSFKNSIFLIYFNHPHLVYLKDFYNKYEGSFTKMTESKNKKSSLFDALYMHSPKMLYAIFNILKSPGSTLVYSNYVEMEGLEMFKVYLAFFGFISLQSYLSIRWMLKKKAVSFLFVIFILYLFNMFLYFI